MSRPIFLVLIAIFSFGCSANASHTIRTERAANQPDDTLDATHEAHSTPKCMAPANAEYVCDEMGVYSGSDVSTFYGYHIIAFVKDSNGATFAHVADTCQHYFCAVDTPPSDTQCKAPKIRTIGCCLAHPKQ